MSLNIPANVEHAVEQYAQSERISPSEAVVKLIQTGLNVAKRQPSKGELSEAEWEKLRANPVFTFLENLPDSVADSIEAASKQTRAEKFKPRG